MKNLDLRSTMIGFLSCLCLFLIMGQTSGIKEYDTLKVNKLIIEHKYMKSTTTLDGYSIEMMEDKYRLKNFIDPFGYTVTNELGNDQKFIMNLSAGNTGNEKKFYGIFQIFNKHGEQTGFMGQDVDQHGLIQLNDKYGDVGRQLSGKN